MIAGKTYYWHYDTHIHICPICREGDMSYVECPMKGSHIAETCAQCRGQNFIFCPVCYKAEIYNGPPFNAENDWRTTPCKDCESEYRKFWQEFIEKNGTIDPILVRRELHKYRILIEKHKTPAVQGPEITYA